MKLIFLRKNLLSQKFDQERLRSELKADHSYLTSGITFMKRMIRFGVWREIRRFRPDIVVTQEFSDTTLTVVTNRWASKTSFRHVVWTDDNPESVLSDKPVRRFLRQYVLPRIDGLIVLSKETAEHYRMRYGVKVPIGVSPIVHDEEYFKNKLTQSMEISRSYAATHGLVGKRVILFVGRLAPEKRVDRLVEAFAVLQASIPDAMLVLVGEGPERGRLQALAKSSGIIKKTIFTGRLEGESLLAWYLLGGLFVLASQFETFGAVVNEALLAGMPVVCSDRAGARVLIQDGVNGTVVNASDQIKLQSAIHAWLLRTAPLATSSLVKPRPSLMLTTFQEAVDGFVSLLQAVMQDADGTS
ncbi:MAG: glycosyltransferase [Deltaproteobacteria bacterium]|nr:glycosyltransferase [Deltaproteobacteria bacterium]